MSEEIKKIFCTECGGENDEGAKFCKNCGAKLQIIAASTNEAADDTQAFTATEGLFSSQEATPVFEKITDAEVVTPIPTPAPTQDEININYNATSDTDTNGNIDSKPQYYTNEEPKKTNGNIGLAIASLVCGIVSMLCCCFTIFSLILGIAAVVLGIIAIYCNYDGKGMAIAGIVTGGIGIFVWLIFVIIGGTSFYKEILDEVASEF